jgi:peptidyl-prolyl cis-trans isomerase C/peptidyl-prolyl cis-trans isomerase D
MTTKKTRSLGLVSLRRALILASVFVAGAIAARGLQAAVELARINNSVITVEDFNKKYKENLKFFQFKAPSKKSVLDDLIKRELGIQEAKKEGLDRDPEVIERMNTVLYHALLDKRLSKSFEDIHVSDAEAKDFYSKNPEIRTSHIFIAVPANASKADDDKALARLKDIETNYLKPGKMSFAEVAQKYSEGVAAPMGGDIDYQTRDKLDPAYYDAAMGLKTVGRVTDHPVRSQFGWHIIKLTGVRSWDDVDRAAVKRAVFDEKRAEIFDRYMTQLRKTAKVQVNADMLKD